MTPFTSRYSRKKSIRNEVGADKEVLLSALDSMPNDGYPSLDLRDVQLLVNEQYDLTVSFCNAQTSLLNAAAAPAAAKQQHHASLVDEYSTCLRRVQDNWIKLKSKRDKMQNISELRRVWTVYQAHVARTERVLLTVQRSGGGVWTTHGLSLSLNDSDTVTVALATLRASVEDVQQVLSMYVKKE